MQASAEDFQQRLLAFENALFRFRYRKPAAPIDFGDLNQTLRPGRPLDLTQIAFQVLGIAVSLKAHAATVFPPACLITPRSRNTLGM